MELTFEERQTPKNYYNYPEGQGMSETIEVWPVQTVSFGEPWMDPGVVSTPAGFEDSPDCEVISGGLNSKGPNSVAIGRQANLFLWGFFAPPSKLTDEAKQVFVNAICYIDRFDGRRPLVKKTAMSRDALDSTIRFAELMGDRGEQILGHSFSNDLIEQLGTDTEAYRAWVEENREYLVGFEETISRGEYEYQTQKVRLDEDVKSLGISNRDIKLLETCISMLERSEKPELARRVLSRYTGRSFETAEAWRAWLEEHRNRLFFSDVGGYRWMVNPHAGG